MVRSGSGVGRSCWVKVIWDWRCVSGCQDQCGPRVIVKRFGSNRYLTAILASLVAEFGMEGNFESVGEIKVEIGPGVIGD